MNFYLDFYRVASPRKCRGRGVNVHTKERHEPRSMVRDLFWLFGLDEGVPVVLGLIQFSLKRAVDPDEALDDADQQLGQQRRRPLCSLRGVTPGFGRHRTLRKGHFDRSNRSDSTIFLTLVGLSNKGLLVCLTTICWLL